MRNNPSRCWGFWLPLLFLLLASCDSDTPNSSQGTTVGVGSEPKSRYAMANSCYALQADSNKAYVGSQSDGSYVAAQSELAAAEPFYMKPTALGSYLLYNTDGAYMGANGTPVETIASASPATDWVINELVGGAFELVLGSQKLAIDDAGLLQLADRAEAFRFKLTTGCASFPEISLNATGTTFSGTLDDGTVLGIADTHNHLTGLEGFGEVYGYGFPFHKYGVEHALGDCTEDHGPGGNLAIEGNFVETGTPFGPHDTQGWPSFVDWPAWNSAAHQHLYYKWVERAWLAGLRIMVSHVQENEVLCSLQRQLPRDCNEMNGAKRQLVMLREMQDYIDAQEGGPDKGWFRIVTDSRQARRVIEDGKLAVILGIETSNLFDCSVSFPAPGVEQRGCTKETFDAQLEEFYELGVRAFFPVHEFNNALGGSAIFGGTQGDILNAGNRIQTGEFWRTYRCEDKDYYYVAGSRLTGAPLPDNPLNEFIQGPAPSYDSSYNHCNQRQITDLGEYGIGRLMDKGVIIEVDHMEYRMKTEVIAIAEQRDPPHPLVSGHGGHGGIDIDQMQRIYELGGIISGYQGAARKHVGPEYEKARAIFGLADENKEGLIFAKGFGQDANGLSTLAQPQAGHVEENIAYPFTLFSGDGWGEEFESIAPVKFDKQTSGVKEYDFSTEGMAHYGLVADWVEEVRIAGGSEAIRDLYRSAEAYLQMWERAEGVRR